MKNNIIEFAAQVVNYDSDQLCSVDLKRIYDDIMRLGDAAQRKVTEQ